MSQRVSKFVLKDKSYEVQVTVKGGAKKKVHMNMNTGQRTIDE